MDYNDLRDRVDAEGGLHATSMEILRDIHGAGRLGVHVRDAISKALRANGMGHLPDELPSWQGDEVRIYRLGTPTADAISAVLYPSPRGDESLRNLGQSEAHSTLRKIRELVCE